MYECTYALLIHDCANFTVTYLCLVIFYCNFIVQKKNNIRNESKSNTKINKFK